MESHRTHSLRVGLITLLILAGTALAHPESPLDAKLYEIKKFGRLDLSTLRGKKAIVTFFQPDCLPCREQLKALRCLKETMPTTAIVAAGIGDTLALKKEIGPLKLNFPAVESTGRFQESIGGVPSTPYTLLVDEAGLVTAKESGAKSCEQWKQATSPAKKSSSATL